MEIVFKLKSSKTKWGQQVCLSGNLPELGNWNVKQGRKFVTDRYHYPTWKIKESLKLSRAE